MEKEYKIVIAQRGWVLVGEFERKGHHVILKNGATVRRWGTTGDGKGLGYLAYRGPTEETELEPFTLPFETLELTVVGMHTCNPEIWAGVLDSLRLPE